MLNISEKCRRHTECVYTGHSMALCGCIHAITKSHTFCWPPQKVLQGYSRIFIFVMNNSTKHDVLLEQSLPFFAIKWKPNGNNVWGVYMQTSLICMSMYTRVNQRVRYFFAVWFFVFAKQNWGEGAQLPSPREPAFMTIVTMTHTTSPRESAFMTIVTMRGTL
jgi:hypothetical protein